MRDAILPVLLAAICLIAAAIAKYLSRDSGEDQAHRSD
jgi:hypothetical protein